jgi:hypothetical protein
MNRARTIAQTCAVAWVTICPLICTATPARAGDGSTAPSPARPSPDLPAPDLPAPDLPAVNLPAVNLPGLNLAGLNLSGSVRSGYWSSDRRLDDRRNFTPSSVWLRAAPDFGDGWYARAEGWILDERPLGTGSRLLGDVREAYVGWRDDQIEVTLGRRIIAWGRADRVNPTDIISTRDYLRLFADDDDLRQGSVVGTASYAFGDATVTALWTPEFRPNVYPIPPEPGVSIKQGTDRLGADQFALRLDRTGPGIDWSMSYFNGINRNPGSSIVAASTAGELVNAVYDRVQMLGADAATNVGPYGLRGEIAYSWPGAGHGSAYNPRPFAQVVIGADRNIGEHLNINVQYTILHVFSYEDPATITDPVIASVAAETALVNNQRLRTQHGPMLRVSYSLSNDTLSLEMTAQDFISDHSFVVRPRVKYAINDRVNLLVGADIFYGSSRSFFGQLKPNNGFLSEIRYSF